MRFTWVAVLLFVGCKGESKPEPRVVVPVVLEARPPKLGGPVVRGKAKLAAAEVMYAVALPEKADVAKLEKFASKRSAAVEVSTLDIAESIEPMVVQLMTRDLAPAEAANANKARTMISVSATGTDAPKIVREAASVVRDVADASKGWVFDLTLGTSYTAEDFHEHVPGAKLDARKLVLVHQVSGDNSAPFLVTAGLRRYGFPELFFPNASPGQTDQITHLVTGAAQWLLDNGDVGERGEIAVDFRALGWEVGIIEKGSGKAVWKTRWAKEDPADEEMVIELVPPKHEGAEGAAAMIDECFGFVPEKLVSSTDNDPELLAAAARARADLKKLEAHFAKGIPPGEELLVKTKFTNANDEGEWMWVNVVAYRGKTFEGMLANDPQVVTTLRNGSKVKVKFADVADYLHNKQDGSSAGGYSIEILTKREGNQ